MIYNDTLLVTELLRKIEPGKLTLLAGVDNSGKTSLAVKMAEYEASADGRGIIYFSLEHDKETLLNKYIENNMEFYIDDTSGISITDVKDKCRDYAQKYDLRTVFVDYVLLMSGSGTFVTRVEEWQEIMNELKVLARELNIAVVAIAPLIHYGKQRKPKIADFRECGFAIEQIADLILFMSRKNWDFEITLCTAQNDEKNNVTYRYRDDWSAAVEFDEQMQEYEENPLYKEGEKEQCDVMRNMDFLWEAYKSYENELKESLDKAIFLATKYHFGQRDTQGENYILHPIRVMLQEPRGIFREVDWSSMMIAVLHDILEDTECTEDILREEGIPENVIEGVKWLTRNKDEEYFSYISRVNQNSCCKRIKQKDIEDNLREGCPESLKKRYQKALEILKDRGPYYLHKIIKGNIDLAYSGQKDDDNVYVYCEQRDESQPLKTAMIRKNDLEIIGNYGFSHEELQIIIDEV